MTVLRCKGYWATVEFDAEDGLLVGRLAGITDVVGFHSDSVAGLKEALEQAVDDYVATCERCRKTPEKRFSGQLMVRVSPEVHASAALAAELRGISLKQWAEEAIHNAAEADLAAV
jgi:predicted HicB family RNase H-like nuclease